MAISSDERSSSLDQLAWPIPFTKMSGSGNDFIVIDNRAGLIPSAITSDFTRLVCRHRVSVGADGVVLIELAPPNEPTAHFRWRYINADGSDGEMCGNGAICGARFAVLHKIAPPQCVFATASGLVYAHVEAAATSPRVHLDMVTPSAIKPEIKLTVERERLTVDAIIVGVPHAVAFTGDADAFAPGAKLDRIGRAVRHHPCFAPDGTNLNIVSVLDPHRLRMRTYERGVEAETLACGTSAVAATARGFVTPPVAVVTSSGRALDVDFTWDGQRASAVTLAGEGRIVATGEIGPEALW